MARPMPLGVYDTGNYPALLDDDGMWDWSVQRSEGPGFDSKLARACSRPTPPTSFSSEGHLGAAYLEGAKLDNLKRAGWAVLFGPNTSDEIKKQIAPLIQYRREQIQNDDLCKVFDGSNGGYKAGQSAAQWLGEFKVSAVNSVNPAAGVPFYIMIVASPDDIPFEFQYDLDVYWGVGRLWLEKDEDYGAYAQAVIEYENPKQPPSASRRMTFFTPRFERDNGATALICDGLVTPLQKSQFADEYQFGVDVITGKDANRDRLIELYSGVKSRPSIYFCGTHGLLRAVESAHLADTMGALLCEVWPGDVAPGKGQYMAGRDLPGDADLRGTVHFLFCCYGGGWPMVSSYDGAQIAPKTMVARLPQTILAKGGLAVLAHIDRGWSYSFQAGNGIDRSQEFGCIFTRFMDGARAGHATDQYNMQWGILGNQISRQMRDSTIESTEAAHNLWVEHDDARNYVLYGDPAVRLRVEDLRAEG